jgi:Zinc-finger of C2H2 type
VPPRRAKRPVSPSEYTPTELAEVEDFERRYHQQETASSSSSSSQSTSDDEITPAAPSTTRSIVEDKIPRLTPEKRRTIQLQKTRQGLGAQAAELKAIRKSNNRIGGRRCRVCQLTCNSASALRFHLESSKHARRAKEVTRRAEGPPRCNQCEKDFNNYGDLESHIRGKYHIRTINFLASQ